MMIPFISLYGQNMMLRSLDIGQLVIGRPRLNFLLRPGDTTGDVVKRHLGTRWFHNNWEEKGEHT